MINNAITGNLIKKLRKEAGFTQNEFATYLNVTKPAVSKWENGNGIKTTYLYDIAKLFNVSVADLINGKLKQEKNVDYFDRNYNLKNYEFEEVNNDIDKVKEFYHCCKLIKNKFFELLPLWAKEELNANQIEEFHYLKKYFNFDFQYYSFCKYETDLFNLIYEEKEKEFVNVRIEKSKKISSEEYIWELHKLYNFNSDLKEKEILESGNEKAVEYLLSCYNQPIKDSFMMKNLSHEVVVKVNNGFLISDVKSEAEFTNDEIEKNGYFKVMLNNNCHVMKKYKTISPNLSAETFEHLEGIIKIIDLDNNLNNYDSYTGFKNESNKDILKNWKLYSYQEYQDQIDYKQTNYLISLVNNKNEKPLKYLNDLINKCEN